MSPKCKSHTRGNWTKEGDIPCNYDRYQTTAKHKAGKFTTLNEPVIRATFHYPVFMLHIYVHVKVLGTVCDCEVKVLEFPPIWIGFFFILVGWNVYILVFKHDCISLLPIKSNVHLCMQGCCFADTQKRNNKQIFVKKLCLDVQDW